MSIDNIQPLNQYEFDYLLDSLAPEPIIDRRRDRYDGDERVEALYRFFREHQNKCSKKCEDCVVHNLPTNHAVHHERIEASINKAKERKLFWKSVIEKSLLAAVGVAATWITVRLGMFFESGG